MATSLLVCLLSVDVPRELCGREAVAADARHVHPVAHVVPRVTPLDLGAAARERCKASTKFKLSIGGKSHCKKKLKGGVSDLDNEDSTIRAS